MKSTSSKLWAACLLIALFLGATVPASSFADHPALGSVIRLAPPAPVFTDQERHEELASRRARVAQAVGTNGMLIIFSAEPGFIQTTFIITTGRKTISIT